MNPKIDYVFKRIFGHTGNEEITKGLLSSIIPDKIQEIEIDCNPITEKDLFDDKIGILDIKAKLNDNINCNIEMQVVDRKNIENRILFYWSKMYASSIKSGEDYDSLERTIVILFTDYSLDKLKEIPEYLTKWNIREEKYPHLILTNALEIYIIELDKAQDFLINGNTELDSWLKFINNPEVKSNMDSKEIKKAKKVLEEISQDARERRLTELREKYIMDQHAIEARGYDKGLEAGISRGIEQGIQQGIQQGIEKNTIEIVKKMHSENFDINIISKITELTDKQISEILSD